MPRAPSKPKNETPAKDAKSLVIQPSSPLPTPALDSPDIKFNYAIARGEQGVLSYDPYKSLILPYWAFRTVPIAESSSSALWAIFTSYVQRGDFVGADMTRKFIQMGMTRARRYANWKGGRKYVKGKGREGGGPKQERWTGEGADGEEGRKRREKEEASEVFKGVWRRCIEDEGYAALKEEWIGEMRAWENGRGVEKGGKVKKEDSSDEVKEENEDE